MKKTFTPEVLWEPSATPDAKKIGQQKRGFTFTLIPENSPDHSYKIYYSFTLHRWSVNYYYLSEEGGFIVFDEYERGELVKAAGEPPFFKQLEFDFNDNGMPTFRLFPNTPTPVCECGATKMGVSEQQPYHSDWCPVKNFVP